MSDPVVPRGTSASSQNTSQNASAPDYAAWLTKQQAADALDVSTKTIETLAKDGKLQQAVWRRPTGGPKIVVYHPADVARLASTATASLSPFVLGPDPAGNGNGHAAIAPTSPFSNYEEARQMFVAGAVDLVRAFRAELPNTRSETSHTSEKFYLTVDEAAAVSGLSRAFLRRMITNGTLTAIKDRGWKIRRKDLEQL